MPNPLITAHAACRGHAPENTLAGIHTALELGADAIEIDVRCTRDGTPVLLHDATVDRTTDGSGPVSGKTLAEIQKLDAGLWFGPDHAPAYAGEPIHTLAEVLQAYKGRLHLHIEIKARDARAGLARRTIDMVRGHGLTEGATITSFHKHWLQEAADYDSVLPKGWLVPLGPGSQWEDSIIDEAKDLGITQICPRADITTPEVVSKIRAAGFVVRCQGLTNEELMRHVVDIGADGATVNFPDKMTEYLKAKGIEQAP